MHFSLLVIAPEHEDLDALMDPYWQDNIDSDIAEFEEDEACDVDPITGKRGCWWNPQTEWDWWVIGGRFAERLILKDGTRADRARIADLDLDALRDRAFYTFAVMEDGYWEQIGEWSFFSEEPSAAQRSFVDDYLACNDPSLFATVIDCHI